MIGRRTLKLLLLICLALALPPLAFYGWFEAASRSTIESHSLDPRFRNALKHAQASSALYAGQRTIFLPIAAAEATTIRLGMINEWVEQYVKRGRPDDTLEMMKDLQNNLVGVIVAQWLEGNHGDRTDLLIRLGDGGLLLLSRDGVAVDGVLKSRASGAQDFGLATAWFLQNQTGIRADVTARLEQAFAAQSNAETRVE